MPEILTKQPDIVLQLHDAVWTAWPHDPDQWLDGLDAEPSRPTRGPRLIGLAAALEL